MWLIYISGEQFFFINNKLFCQFVVSSHDEEIICVWRWLMIDTGV